MEYRSLIQLMVSNKTLFAKKVMTPLFLVSVSLFSFVFSNSCSWPWWWHSFLYPFIKFYFSSLPMQVLSHALNKTWIFLICNGIVVVIANTSSINTVQYNSPPPPLDGKAGNYDHNSVLELLPEPGNAVCELLEEKENDTTATTTAEEGDGNREPETISCITGDDDGELENEEEEEEEEEEKKEEEDQSQTCLMMMMEEEEEEEEEEDQGQVYEHDHNHDQGYEYEYEGGGGGMDKLSTEELNKKFEDFIRKMKEELRIQLVQQQQLILSC